MSKANPDHSRWLVLIGVLKLFKAALFILLGVGALRLLHKDLVDVVTHFILALRFDPENHFINLVLERVAMISPHRLREISIAIFLYAALDIIEGTGACARKDMGGVSHTDPDGVVFALGTLRDHPSRYMAESCSAGVEYGGRGVPRLPCTGQDPGAGGAELKGGRRLNRFHNWRIRWG